MITLKKGDIAPNFTAENQNSEMVSLSDYKGKKVVLYFYPKDMTPGCTNQACNLRDNYDLLTEAGITILGVSPDDTARHQKFIGKYDLPFSLLADTEKKIIEQYGVWGKKKFMGKVFDGVFRTTFLIDEEGKIFEIIDKPKVKEHAEEIMELWQNNN